MPSRNSWLERANQMLSVSNYVTIIDHTPAVVYAHSNEQLIYFI